MKNGQKTTKNILETIKLLLALIPIALLFALFFDALVEMFELDISINFKFLWALWIIPLWLFIENRIDGEERWNRIGTLWICIFYGFLYSSISLLFLGILLQWTLDISIQEFDRFVYLSFIVWIGWIIVVYFSLKHKWNIF